MQIVHSDKSQRCCYSSKDWPTTSLTLWRTEPMTLRFDCSPFCSNGSWPWHLIATSIPQFESTSASVCKLGLMFPTAAAFSELLRSQEGRSQCFSEHGKVPVKALTPLSYVKPDNASGLQTRTCIILKAEWGSTIQRSCLRWFCLT